MENNFKKFIYILCTALIVSFIFYNSIQNGKSSAEASTYVLNVINKIFETLNINFKISGYMVRKLAHFTEFFVFGAFLMLTFSEFSKKTFSILGYPLFFSILIPAIDEYIQLYSVGRSSSVKDVFIDFFGAATGLIIICIIVHIKNKRNKSNFRYKIRY